MVELSGQHPAQHGYPIHWYIVCAIVGGCFAVLVGLTVCVYQCYRRRADTRQDPNIRLSTAIRRGLMKEYRSGSEVEQSSLTNTPSIRSTGSTQSGGGSATHQDTPSNLFRGGWGGNCQPPSSVGINESRKIEYSVVSETKRSPTSPQEKGQSRTEKAAENDGKMATVLGTLHFTVQYDSEKAALIVSITRAKDLPPKDLNAGSSDPYVKLQLLPDKRQKVKTRVLRKTLNPVFDEIFTFYGIDDNQLSGVTLHFVILSYDRFSRDDIIGEVIHPLSECELAKIPTPICKEIQPRYIRMAGEGLGELLVSVCHHPAANRLTVVILKARNLPKMDITGLSDPYVKIYLRSNGQRISKKKTHVKKRTLNPVFNESFIFDLPMKSPEVPSATNSLENISLELYVLDWDQMTKNEVIGRLEIGKQDTPGRYNEQETRHWNEALDWRPDDFKQKYSEIKQIQTFTNTLTECVLVFDDLSKFEKVKIQLSPVHLIKS